MDLQFVRKLIKIINESEIDEIEIEEDSRRLRITKTKPIVHTTLAGQPHIVTQPALAPFHEVTPSFPLTTQQAETETVASTAQAAKEIVTYHEIHSPIVGTFYRAPSPDAKPYVHIGQEISIGTPLCIIEAMKIMNVIESDIAGKIIKILIEDSQPVEYNQPLFVIEPA